MDAKLDPLARRLASLKYDTVAILGRASSNALVRQMIGDLCWDEELG